MTLRVSPKNWYLYPGQDSLNVEEWLHLESLEFLLPPGMKIEIPFTVTIPAKTREGVPSSGVFVGMASFTGGSDPESMVQLVMSVSIYAIVKGTEKVEAGLSKFEIRTYNDSLQAVSVIENKGNIHIRPSGVAEIFDAKNNKVEIIPIPEQLPAFPAQSRGYIGNIPRPDWKKGKYRAKLKMNYAEGRFLEKDFFFKVSSKGEILPLGEKKARKIWKIEG